MIKATFSQQFALKDNQLLCNCYYKVFKVHVMTLFSIKTPFMFKLKSLLSLSLNLLGNGIICGLQCNLSTALGGYLPLTQLCCKYISQANWNLKVIILESELRSAVTPDETILSSWY